MKLDIPFDSYPGNDVFKPYRYFYEEHINKAADGLELINVLELGSDLGISGRMFCEILDAIGKSWKLTFVDVNYRLELSKIIDNEHTFFLHSNWEDAITKFGDSSIDVLHIDVGDHTYDDSKAVFDLYKNKVKPSGCMLWHDASPLVFTVHNFLAWELQPPVSGYEVIFCEEHQPFPQAAPAMCRRLVIG